MKVLERDDPRSFDERSSDAVAWAIPLRDRLKLEVVSRASHTTVEQFGTDQWEDLEFRGKVAEILIRRGLEAKADRYMLCSTRVGIVVCTGPDQHEFKSPYYCDLRFCERCAKRGRARLFERHSPVLDYIKAHPKRGLGLRRITLTAKNVGVLTHDQITTFNRHVRDTITRVLGDSGAGGAIAVLEVGFNNTNLHAHILAWCPYVEQRLLSDVWREISGHQSVWINREVNSGAAALGYMLKYVGKPPSDIPEMIGQLEVAFHETRRVHCYGIFVGFSGEDADAEDSVWTSCPKCGASLERVLGTWDQHDLPSKSLEFIGDVRRQQDKRKWIN